MRNRTIIIYNFLLCHQSTYNEKPSLTNQKIEKMPDTNYINDNVNENIILTNFMIYNFLDA